MGRGSDEALDRFAIRAEAVEVAGEPPLLLVQVVELRVAARDRRGIGPDFRGEALAHSAQMLCDLPLQGGEVSFGYGRHGRNSTPAHSALMFAARAIRVNTATSSRISWSKASGLIGRGVIPIGPKRS